LLGIHGVTPYCFQNHLTMILEESETLRSAKHLALISNYDHYSLNL